MQEQTRNFLKDRLSLHDELAQDITLECHMIFELYFAKSANHSLLQELIQKLDWAEHQ